MNGWIQLHRKLLDNPVFKNHKLLQTFLYCLLSATHTEREQIIGEQIVKLNPGQLATGREAIARATGLTSQNVRTALKKLKTLQILTIKPTTKYSVISITNWESYQQTNQQVTNIQPTSNQQTNHKQELLNNVNNVNKKDIVKAKRFAPPTHIEAEDYFLERNHPNAKSDSESFVDYWESIGWVRNKVKMKDWKAAARTWMKNNYGAPNGQRSTKQSSRPMSAPERVRQATGQTRVESNDGSVVASYERDLRE